MIETKYVVNGVEYTDLAEAEAASKKFEEEQAAKKDAALARKADVEVVQNAANAYLDLVAENNKKREELKNAEAEAYEAYKKELNDFSNKHKGYHLTYTSDGENVEFKVEEAKSGLLEKELDNIRRKTFNLFNSFWF